MNVKSKYNFGDIVYVINDPKQKPYHVVGFTIRPGGVILLELDYIGETLEMFEFQVSDEKDVMATLKFNENDDD